MDMGTSTTMDMAATGTASSAAAATTSAMSMSMGGGNPCKISVRSVTASSLLFQYDIVERTTD